MKVINYQVVESFSCGIMTIEILKFEDTYFISRNGGITVADYKAYPSLEEAREQVIELLQNTREEIEAYIASHV